jgi:hypothetical protein
LATPIIGQVGAEHEPQSDGANVVQGNEEALKQTPAPPVGVKVIVTLEPAVKPVTE